MRHFRGTFLEFFLSGALCRLKPGLLTCAALCLLATGCGKQAPAGFAPPPARVSVAEAIAEDVPIYLDEIGQGTAFEAVIVTPQVSGQIIERHFEDGAEVKTGQKLFTIDTRPFEAQLNSAQAQLAQSRAALDLAKIQLNMYASVADTRAVSKSDYDTRKSTVDMDAASVQAAQAAVETARLNLDYCHIASPIDGRAGRRLVDVGNVVTANQTALLTIQRLDPFYADFTITERDLPRVQRELGSGTLKTLVRLPSDPMTNACPGELTFLDNAVQTGSGRVSLRATIPNAKHRFWPGQFVQVRLVLTVKKGAVLVPNQATQISQQGPYVYVIKPDLTAELRQITLGQRQGDSVVVESGITAGERVVLTGQMGVIPGQKVEIEGGSPGGAVAGQPASANFPDAKAKTASEPDP